MVQVSDCGDALPVVQEIPIAVKGEAYKIELDVKFPQQDQSGVDFGLLRVVDDASRTISMKNTGKYTVAYKLLLRTPLVAELITVLPEEGSIDPGKEVVIMVRKQGPAA
jgi:hydrocephalus-inducing protein